MTHIWVVRRQTVNSCTDQVVNARITSFNIKNVRVFPTQCVCVYRRVNGKVKCTLVQSLRLCTGRKAHRGSTDIALLFLDHGTRRGRGASVTPRPLFASEKDPVPIVQEAGWAPGPVWTRAENLAPHRDLIPGPSSP